MSTGQREPGGPLRSARPRRHRHTWLIVVSALVLVAGLIGLLTLVGRGPGANAILGGSTPAGSAPVWADEFDGPAGSSVDESRWNFDTGGEGWGNQELQYYTDNSKNAYLDGQGNLAIVARADGAQDDCWYGKCRYSSARLTTHDRFAQQYGRFEARIKVPSGQGIWSAFWLLGANIDEVGYPQSGEIDVMEHLGHEVGSVHANTHGPGEPSTNQSSTLYTLPNGARFADDFHVFAVDWTPSEIRYSVDGIVYRTDTRQSFGGGWVFDHPFYLLLNVAVGGDWPGAPDGSTVFPARMLVDYVRVYAQPSAP